MASQSLSRGSTPSQPQNRSSLSSGANSIDTMQLLQGATEKLNRLVRPNIRQHVPSPGITVGMGYYQQGQLSSTQHFDPVLADPVRSNYHLDSRRTNPVTYLDFLGRVNQQPSAQFSTYDETLSSLSRGELISMIQKYREDQHLQQIYDREQSSVRVTPQNFTSLRYQHENEGQDAYLSMMMKQTIQNQCKQANEDQAKIADLEQKIKKLTLEREEYEIFGAEVTRKRLKNEVKIVQLEEKIEILTLENKELRHKAFKFDQQNGIMQSNHRNEIEEKDKFISNLGSQLDSGQRAPSGSKKSWSQNHNPAASYSEAGDRDYL